MKSKSFLIFTAVIIIAVIVCIILDFKTQIMVSLIVGYLIPLAINASRELSRQNDNEAKEAKEKKKMDVGSGIGVGIGIGFSLAVIGGFPADSFTVAIFLFIGSVLGAIVGLMYKA